MTTATTAPTWTLEAAAAWRDAAVADGWMITPTYGHRESVDRAATLEREGWHVQVYTRPAGVNISAWGPDKLALRVPPVYSWADLQRGLTTCLECGAHGPTVRLLFAGRVCPDCRARLAPELERGNWTA